MAWNLFNLFKYDPVADADKTFNLDEGMNDNWDAIKARDAEITGAIDEANNIIRSKADKSTMSSATIAAASWSGSSAPYSYTLAVSGVTATSNQELLPSVSITVAQLKALQSANIQDYSQAAGSITIRAWGTKPTIDIPIRIIVRGDM